MKFAFAGLLLLSSLSSFAASKRIAQCAVNHVGNSGVRVNLRKMESGEFKANLIFGSTVSGILYHLKEVSPGVYEGAIRNKPQFPMKLVITSTETVNRYVVGYASALRATYPDLNARSGRNSVKTTIKDNFVCGKIISRF